jgi:hypothetical protein
MRATTPSRRSVRVVTIDWHDCAWRPRIKTRWAGLPGSCYGPAAERTPWLHSGGLLPNHRRIQFPTL